MLMLMLVLILVLMVIQITFLKLIISNANLNASPKASTKKTIANTYATANSNNAVFRNRLKEQDRNISLKYEYDRC